jgi:hypothetical protein
LEQTAQNASTADRASHEIAEISIHRLLVIEPHQVTPCLPRAAVGGSSNGLVGVTSDRSQASLGVDHTKDTRCWSDVTLPMGPGQRGSCRHDGLSYIAINQRQHTWRQHTFIGPQGPVPLDGQETLGQFWTPSQLLQDARFEAPRGD